MKKARRIVLMKMGASLVLLAGGWRSAWAAVADMGSLSAREYYRLRQLVADQYAECEVVLDNGWIVSRREHEFGTEGDSGQ